MKNEEYKTEFGRRLKQALNSAGFANISLSSIATKFNLRYPNKPITPQTVHNWLIGASLPSLDKVDTLAKWLNTTPEWLLYGITHIRNDDLSDDEYQILSGFRKISSHKQELILKILQEFNSSN